MLGVSAMSIRPSGDQPGQVLSGLIEWVSHSGPCRYMTGAGRTTLSLTAIATSLPCSAMHTAGQSLRPRR